LPKKTGIVFITSQFIYENVFVKMSQLRILISLTVSKKT